MFKLQYYYLESTCTTVLSNYELLDYNYALWKYQNQNYQYCDDFNCIDHPIRFILEKSMDSKYFSRNHDFFNDNSDFERIFEFIHHVYYFYQKSMISDSEAIRKQKDFQRSNEDDYMIAESIVNRFSIDYNRKICILELDNVGSSGKYYAYFVRLIKFIKLKMIFKNIKNIKMEGNFSKPYCTPVGMVHLESGKERKYSWSMYWGSIGEVFALELECDEILYDLLPQRFDTEGQICLNYNIIT